MEEVLRFRWMMHGVRIDDDTDWMWRRCSEREGERERVVVAAVKGTLLHGEQVRRARDLDSDANTESTRIAYMRVD